MLLNSLLFSFSLFIHHANGDDNVSMKNYDYKDIAGWMVRNNGWGTISASEINTRGSETKHFENHPFVDVDGVHNNSTGSIYIHGQPKVDSSYLHRYAASGQKIAFSINPPYSYECLNDHGMDLNNWQCMRLVVTGTLVNVTATDWEEEEEVALSVKKAFKERHDLSMDTDLTYRLSISEMRLIQVLTGDSLKVDLDLYDQSREEPRMMDKSSIEISPHDKDFVRKMKAVHLRRKHLRVARAVA